eukprot:3940731-Rhodomonas_salina.3
MPTRVASTLYQHRPRLSETSYKNFDVVDSVAPSECFRDLDSVDSISPSACRPVDLEITGTTQRLMERGVQRSCGSTAHVVDDDSTNGQAELSSTARRLMARGVRAGGGKRNAAH